MLEDGSQLAGLGVFAQAVEEHRDAHRVGLQPMTLPVLPVGDEAAMEGLAAEPVHVFEIFFGSHVPGQPVRVRRDPQQARAQLPQIGRRATGAVEDEAVGGAGEALEPGGLGVILEGDAQARRTQLGGTAQQRRRRGLVGPLRLQHQHTA